MHMFYAKNMNILKLILYNDFLWNRDFNYDIHFIN